MKALQNSASRKICYTYSRNSMFLVMTPPTAFQPLTKENVADLLGISTRCIENWVNNGTLIAPARLGNRVYWHPEVFFKWLGDYLIEQHAAAVTATTPASPVDEPCEHSGSLRGETNGNQRELTRLQNKTQKRLANLMGS